MLSLEILSESAPAPALPDPADSGVTVWRDVGGRLCALGQSCRPESWLHLLDFASYAFREDSGVVRARPWAGVGADLVVDLFHRTVVPMVLQTRGFGALHASAVRLRSGVVALCATKESGKSTLAYALGQRGHALWADDAMVFRTVERGVEALSVPFDVRLRPASAHHFGQPGRIPVSADHRKAGLPFEAARAPLAAVVVLHRLRQPVSEPEVVCRRLGEAASFRAVLAHAYCFRLEGPGKRVFLEQLLALPARVPVHELVYRTGLERLPDLVDAIERVGGNADVSEREPARG